MILEFTHEWDCPLVVVREGVRLLDWTYSGERLDMCACAKYALETYWAEHRIRHGN